MDTIGAFAAKTHFANLLERVAKGETITITRHGTPVARLVPIAATADLDRRKDVVERLLAFAARHSLRGLDWRELRDEGRK